MDRQVTESVNILAAGKNVNETLNLKTEWGGAKIPSVLVHSPKGLGKQGSAELEEGDMDQEDQETREAGKRLREALRRGQKRLQYQEVVTVEDLHQEQGPGKRRRTTEGEKYEVRSPSPRKLPRKGCSTFAEAYWSTRSPAWTEPGEKEK